MAINSFTRTDPVTGAQSKVTVNDSLEELTVENRDNPEQVRRIIDRNQQLASVKQKRDIRHAASIPAHKHWEWKMSYNGKLPGQRGRGARHAGITWQQFLTLKLNDPAYSRFRTWQGKL